MKNEFIALIILFLLVSCQSRQQVTENISTIDSILQVNVTSLLENKLSELDALSGQAIVMWKFNQAQKSVDLLQQ